MDEQIEVYRTERMETLTKLVESVLKGIVGAPDQLSVRMARAETKFVTCIVKTTEPKDMGRLIGRGGRTIDAVRTIATAYAGDWFGVHVALEEARGED